MSRIRNLRTSPRAEITRVTSKGGTCRALHISKEEKLICLILVFFKIITCQAHSYSNINNRLDFAHARNCVLEMINLNFLSSTCTAFSLLILAVDLKLTYGERSLDRRVKLYFDHHWESKRSVGVVEAVAQHSYRKVDAFHPASAIKVILPHL